MLTEFDKQKLNIIENFRFEKKIYGSLIINLLGVRVKLIIRSEDISLEHLKTYYKFFTEEGQSDFDCAVNLFLAPGSMANINHEIWNERYPKCHFLRSNDKNGHIIIEREYISKVSDKFDTFDVIIPNVDIYNPDTLDNLISVIFSSFGVTRDALILHAAGVVKEDKAYLFYGHSGAGKSTLANLCHKEFDLKIIGSDQVYLRLVSGKLMAQATSITIPEINRNDLNMYRKSVEVVGLYNLTQQGDIGLHQKDRSYLIARFLEESLPYLTPKTDQNCFFNLVTKIFSVSNLKLGQLRYNKNENFWKYLE